MASVSRDEFLNSLVVNLPDGYFAAKWCADTHIWRILTAYAREFASGSAEVERQRSNLNMTPWTGWPSGAAEAGVLYYNYGAYVRQSKAFEQSSEQNIWSEASGASWPSYRQQTRILWDAAMLGGTLKGARLAGQAMCGVGPFIDELYDDARWIAPTHPSGSASGSYSEIYNKWISYNDFAWGSSYGVECPSGSSDLGMDTEYTLGLWTVVVDSGYPVTSWIRLRGSGSYIPGESCVGVRTKSAFTEEKLDTTDWSSPLYMASGSGSFEILHAGRPFAFGSEVSGSFDIRIGSAPHRILEIGLEMRRAGIDVITPRVHGVELYWVR